MAVLSLKMLALLCAVLVLALLADQGSCRPNDEVDSDYNNDEPDYEDEDDDGEDEDEENTGPPPTFNSRPLSMSLRPGDTAHLPCNVQDLGDFVLLWLNGTEPLSMDKQMLTSDKRVFAYPNHTLEVKGVKPEDNGLYTCQIGTAPPLNLTHKLMITYPASIVRITPDSHKRTLMRGDTLSLHCDTTGSPTPSVTWTHMTKHQQPGEGKVISTTASVTYTKVDRSKAGIYECKADNGIGTSGVEKMTIVVNYAPEVSPDKDVIRTGEGEPITLLCTVHAHPGAQVQWLFENETITNSKHHQMVRENSRHSLNIKRLQKSDFGLYTCRATNTHGHEDKFIEVTGVPNIPVFVIRPPVDSTSVTLEWTVESIARITSFSLLYRNKIDNIWKTAHPKVEDPEGHVYTVKYTISEPAGAYEAVLKSENEFGTSESELQTFTQNGQPAAETSTGAREGNNSVADTRPPLLALMTVFILSAFFL